MVTLELMPGLENVPDCDSCSSVDFYRWINELDESSAPDQVNYWLRIRHPVQLRVYDRGLDAELRREWGEVFLALVGCAERYAGYDRWSAASDRKNMRALLIEELGVSGDDHWHPAALLRSVLATLTLQPEEASELSRHWRELPVEQIRLLRHHRNHVGGGVLEMLLRHTPEGPDADAARRWLEVLPSLP